MNKTKLVKKHFDQVASTYDFGKNKYSYYYNNLKKLLKSQIPPNKRVFEVGCGTGDLLTSLDPKIGYGQDISGEMIKIAKEKHGINKNIKFSTSWPKRNLPAGRQEFDYIFMSDVIEHLVDPKRIFEKIGRLMNDKTIFINTMANPIWEPLLMFWERMGWKMKEGPHKRLEFKELKIMLDSSGLKIVRHDYKLLVPINIPIVTKYVNENLEKLFKRYAFIEYFETKK